MTPSTANWLRLFLTCAVLVAALATVLVFAGIVPPFYTRDFSDADYKPATPGYKLVTYDDLEGWRRDDPGPALEAFVRSCEQFEMRDPVAPANPMENLGLSDPSVSFAGTVEDWLRPCAEARALIVSSYAGEANRRGAFRSFFEFHFQPVEITSVRVPLPDGPARRADPKVEREGVFTGYFEPVYKASKGPTALHAAPMLPRPDDLVEVDLGQFRDEWKGERIAGRVAGGRLSPYDARDEIEADLNGAPLAWLDPNDLFFLQIQGSGRLQFEDGDELRVGYAGQNGHPYTAIGRVLVETGEMALEDVTMQSIRAWLDAASPEAATALRHANASYVYFRPLDAASPSLGPLGAQGAPLTPGRSLAVDRRYHTLGAPVWVDIEPITGFEGGEDRLQRLMIAQDTGGAIRGPVRGDVFWGAGEEAGAIAGAMNAQGSMTVLLPRRLADRLVDRMAPSGVENRS